MRNQQFVKRLIISILLVYYHQQTKAARMIKGSKAKNITMANNQTSQTLEITSETESEIKNKMTTIATTTNQPELETTTLPADFEMDGRHAFINNQFIAEDEEESLEHDPAAAAQKQPPRPISGYAPIQSDDYVDEETSDYVSENDAAHSENCADNQSSCHEIPQHDDEPNNVYGAATIYQNNKLYDSTNHKTPTNTNLIGSYYNNNFVPNTHINPGLLYASKPAKKPLAQHLSSLNYQHFETAQQQTKDNLFTPPPPYRLADKLNNSTEALNGKQNLNMQTTSPNNKRFKTVASSVQYVATPLADLVFKYSIGMSKPTNMKAVKKT